VDGVDLGAGFTGLKSLEPWGPCFSTRSQVRNVISELLVRLFDGVRMVADGCGWWCAQDGFRVVFAPDDLKFYHKVVVSSPSVCDSLYLVLTAIR
jgi:hypothetical protein